MCTGAAKGMRAQAYAGKWEMCPLTSGEFRKSTPEQIYVGAAKRLRAQTYEGKWEMCPLTSGELRKSSQQVIQSKDWGRRHPRGNVDCAS